MADTRVAPTKITKLGVRVDALFAAAVIVATTDYVCRNDGRTFLYVKNAGGSPSSDGSRTVWTGGSHEPSAPVFPRPSGARRAASPSPSWSCPSSRPSGARSDG